MLNVNEYRAKVEVKYNDKMKDKEQCVYTCARNEMLNGVQLKYMGVGAFLLLLSMAVGIILGFYVDSKYVNPMFLIGIVSFLIFYLLPFKLYCKLEKVYQVKK